MVCRLSCVSYADMQLDKFVDFTTLYDCRVFFIEMWFFIVIVTAYEIC